MLNSVSDVLVKHTKNRNSYWYIKRIPILVYTFLIVIFAIHSKKIIVTKHNQKKRLNSYQLTKHNKKGG
jgi:hypothetical protein